MLTYSLRLESEKSILSLMAIDKIFDTNKWEGWTYCSDYSGAFSVIRLGRLTFENGWWCPDVISMRFQDIA